MTPASLSMGHLRPASWKCGARGLRATATDADTQAVNWDEMLSKPWGSVDTDFMYFSECKAGETWKYGEVRPYRNLEISPRAAVLNYGQGVFEGMKAQRTEDGKIVLFRPDKNARRVHYGCERLCMPPVPEDVFIKAVREVVLANAKYVPPCGKGSLYLRPLIVGSGPMLGLSPAPSYTFLIFVSPVGSYFKGNQLAPISLKIEDVFSRAAPGGSGGCKAVGNYAGSLLPQYNAKKEGYDNVLFLDAAEKKYLEEVGTSNIFVVKGKTIYTPPCTGGGDPQDTILEGVTRDSVIQVAKDLGYEMKQERVPYEMLWEADEAFTVGTAVVVSSIGAITYKDKKKEWKFEGGGGAVTKSIYETLTGIQMGKVEDKHNWVMYVDK